MQPPSAEQRLDAERGVAQDVPGELLFEQPGTYLEIERRKGQKGVLVRNNSSGLCIRQHGVQRRSTQFSSRSERAAIQPSVNL